MHARRFISCLLSLVFLVSLLTVVPSARADQKHVTAGYGPVYGNLVMPTICKIVKDTIYVMDSYGISYFSLPDNQFIARFNVDLGNADSIESMNDPKLWLELIKELTNPELFGSGIPTDLIPTNFMVSTSIEADTKGDLYISGYNGISQVDPKGQLIQLIPYPEAIIPINEQENSILSFIAVKDRLFLYNYRTSYSEEEGYSHTSTIYELSSSGEVVDYFVIQTDEENPFYGISSSFSYLPEQDFFLLATEQINLINREGEIVNAIPISEEEDFLPMAVDYMDGNSFAFMGIEMTEMFINTAIKQGKIVFEEDEATLEWEESWMNNKWGFLGTSLSADQNRIGFVCSGGFEDMLDFQVNVIELPKKYYSIGKPVHAPGQINNSLSYAIDEEGNLYTTNLGSSNIEVFNASGEYIKSIEIDKGSVSNIMEVIDFMPLITDITYDSGYLYFANLAPTTISRYDLENDSWENLYSGDIMNDTLHLWLDLQVDGENIFLLEALSDQDGLPILSVLTEEGDLGIVEFPPLDALESETLYTGFEIVGDHIYVLDAINSRIYEWFFPDPDEIKKTIQLETDEETLYSSFCLLESGDFVLTNPFKDQIIRTNKDGQTIAKWGKRVPLATGREKEIYYTNPDGFNIPLRVKSQNNLLYVNDLMNCRYHIMVPPMPAPKVIVTDFIQLSNVSVLKDYEQTVEISIESDSLAHFQVKSDEEWIQIKEPAFTSETKELHITLLGSKMKPWANNYGYLHISCDEADLNDQNRITIDISVDAVGVKIQLTIDDAVVLINDKPQPPLVAAPFISNGRTMVPVRFITETFGAKVVWDATTQSITITVNDTSISMQVGNPVVIVNGKEVKLDAPPVIRKGRTFVPLRFIMEVFGAKVDYESATRKITILYPAP